MKMNDWNIITNLDGHCIKWRFSFSLEQIWKVIRGCSGLRHQERSLIIIEILFTFELAILVLRNKSSTKLENFLFRETERDANQDLESLSSPRWRCICRHRRRRRCWKRRRFLKVASVSHFSSLSRRLMTSCIRTSRMKEKPRFSLWKQFKHFEQKPDQCGLQ